MSYFQIATLATFKGKCIFHGLLKFGKRLITHIVRLTHSRYSTSAPAGIRTPNQQIMSLLL